MFGYGNLGIGIAINLHNNFTNQANAIQNSMRMLRKEADVLMRDQVAFLRNSSLIGAGVGLGLIRGMGTMVKTGMEFENTLNSIRAISKASAEDLGLLKMQAFSLSEAFGVSGNDVLMGSKEWIKAGATIEQVLQANRSLVEMGAAAEVPIVGEYGVYEGIISIMSQFQLGAEKAESTVDIITNTLNETKANWFDLLEGFKYSGAFFRNLGMDLGDASALLGTLNQFGVESSTAGTWMANILTYIPRALGPNATKQQVAALKALNMEFQDFVYTSGDMKGEFRPILDWMVPMWAGLQKHDAATRANLMYGLTGMRGSKAQLLLLQSLDKMVLGSTLPELLKSNREAAAGYGLTSGIAAEKTESLKSQTQQLNEAWKNLSVTFTDAITPALLGLIKLVKPIVAGLREFGSTTVGKIFMTMAAGAVVLGTALAGVLALVTSLSLAVWSLRGGFTGLGATVGYALSALGMGGVMGRFLNARTAAAGLTAAAGGRIRGPNGRFMSAQQAQAAMGRNSIGGNILGAGSALLTPGGAARGLAGIRGMWANSGLLGKAGLLGMGAGVGYDLYQGNYGSGLGTLLGAGLGSFIAPGLGTAIGAGVGGWVGSMFDTPHDIIPESEAADTRPYQLGAGLVPDQTQELLMKLATQKKDTNLNIYFNGDLTMQKKIMEGMSEDIYSTIGN